jgi:hypothetical protein
MSALPRKPTSHCIAAKHAKCQQRSFFFAIDGPCQRAPTDPPFQATPGEGAGDRSTQVRLSSVVWKGSSVSISLIGCVFWFHLK